MQALKAHVRHGRLVLDEPTQLPEGTEVELMTVDDDDLDAAERARLLQAVEAGIEDIERGDFVDGLDFANRLLARREDKTR